GRRQVRFPALAQRFDENGDQRQQQEQREEAEGDAEHDALDPRRLARRGALLEARGTVGAALEGGDGAGHQRSPPLRRAVHACRLLIASSRAKDTTSMTVAIAVAPA